MSTRDQSPKRRRRTRCSVPDEHGHCHCCGGANTSHCPYDATTQNKSLISLQLSFALVVISIVHSTIPHSRISAFTGHSTAATAVVGGSFKNRGGGDDNVGVFDTGSSGRGNRLRLRSTTEHTRRKTSSNKNLVQELQTACHTPHDILHNVGRYLSSPTTTTTTTADVDGRLSSLVLVRLAKLMTIQANSFLVHDEKYGVVDASRRGFWNNNNNKDEALSSNMQILQGVCNTLAGGVVSSFSSIGRNPVDYDIGIDGIKAAGIISRLLASDSHHDRTIRPADLASVFRPLAESYNHLPSAKEMLPHHLSGLQWAFDSLHVGCCLEHDREGENTVFAAPRHLKDAYRISNLPFRIRPGFMRFHPFTDDFDATAAAAAAGKEHLSLTVPNPKSQVSFQRDAIQTTSTRRIVRERRQTAWEGEPHIAGFAYSGKVMETRSFSPLVRHVRDALERQTGVRYDCCLINLYLNGKSAMRYHVDPDQGVLWVRETAVVSVGASRRFAFRHFKDGSENKNSDVDGRSDVGLRSKEGKGKRGKRQSFSSSSSSSIPHNFVVMDGDVTEMFGDCQSTYQHCVKPAESSNEMAPRASLVYKKSLRQ